MDKKTPINQSVRFTIIELVIFIILCLIQAAIVSSGQAQTLFARFVVNLLSGYLAMIAGVATTWYVVFTYFLMSSTIEFNRQMLDPFVYVSWEVSSEDPKYKARAIGTLESVPERTNEQAVWVVLIISNTRTKPIDKVIASIGIRCESQSWTPKSYEVLFLQQRLGIEINRSIKIGIVDLSQVPRDVVLNLEIKSLNYRANDSTADRNEINGERIYSQQGLGMIVPGKLPTVGGPSGGTR